MSRKFLSGVDLGGEEVRAERPACHATLMPSPPARATQLTILASHALMGSCPCTPAAAVCPPLPRTHAQRTHPLPPLPHCPPWCPPWWPAAKGAAAAPASPSPSQQPKLPAPRTPRTPYTPPPTPQTKEALARLCVLIHTNVADASDRFFAELRRRYYTTPKSYLDLISLYLQLLGEKR